jgi:hypothetical protein
MPGLLRSERVRTSGEGTKHVRLLPVTVTAANIRDNICVTSTVFSRPMRTLVSTSSMPTVPFSKRLASRTSGASFYDLMEVHGSPIATEAIQRIASLYEIALARWDEFVRYCGYNETIRAPAARDGSYGNWTGTRGMLQATGS